MGARRTGWAGLAFSVLLLVSAGMVNGPTADRPGDEISSFYTTNWTVVLIAEAIGIVAALVFATFTSLLSDLMGERRVRMAGRIVVLVAVQTSIPIVMLAIGVSEPDALVQLSAGTDAALSLAIAAFLGVVASRELPVSIRTVCGIVAVLSFARGLLGQVPAFEVLRIIAPVGFLGSVLVLAVWSFRHPVAKWGD